ncbi:putative sulfate transporter YvdB [Arthrobacter sp. Hiyo1]|nr:putative sulfate transporter YvdB [Arthrobacter sp. Hiyo1]
MIVVAAGLLKLGRVVTLLPWPVIEGFTVGIAVIIFLQQVPAAFGTKPGPSSNAVISAAQAIGTVSPASVLAPTALVALVAVIMIASPRIHPRIPGSLIAIIIATVAAQFLDLPVTRIGALPDSLPAPMIPSLDLATITALAGSAATIAALAAIESLLSARVGASISDTGPMTRTVSSWARASRPSRPDSSAACRPLVPSPAQRSTFVPGAGHALPPLPMRWSCLPWCTWPPARFPASPLLPWPGS